MNWGTLSLIDDFNGNLIPYQTKLRCTYTNYNFNNDGAILIQYCADTSFGNNAWDQGGVTEQATYVESVPYGSVSNLYMRFVTIKNGVVTSHSGYHQIANYLPPKEGNETKYYRADSSGNFSATGTYGYVKVTWAISQLTGNSVQSVVAKNGITTLTPHSGSIALGYFDYLFSLPTSDNASIQVTITDELDSSIFIYDIQKQIVAMSLYDNGVTFGQTAEQDGVWCYNDFYLRSESGNKMYKLSIDDYGVLSCVDATQYQPIIDNYAPNVKNLRISPNKVSIGDTITINWDKELGNYEDDESRVYMPWSITTSGATIISDIPYSSTSYSFVLTQQLVDAMTIVGGQLIFLVDEKVWYKKVYGQNDHACNTPTVTNVEGFASRIEMPNYYWSFWYRADTTNMTININAQSPTIYQIDNIRLYFNDSTNKTIAYSGTTTLDWSDKTSTYLGNVEVLMSRI